MMEEERVRGIREAEQRDRKIREQRRAGAKEIVGQIEMREQQKLIEEELRDQETQAILRQLDEDREKDRLVSLSRVLSCSA